MDKKCVTVILLWGISIKQERKVRAGRTEN